MIHSTEQLQKRQSLGVYIHTPFCDVKCAYCDFYSLARRHPSEEEWRNYLQSLLSDLKKKVPYYAGGMRVVSVFFGGGTPSKAPAWFISEILKSLRRYFSFSRKVEITLEANPESMDLENLAAVHEAGVNRLHIGIQSRDPVALRYLGRLYRREAVEGSVELARSAGFSNIGVDFITGVPGQNWKTLRADLDWAIEQQVDHISAYTLTYERGTSLFQQVEAGRKKKASDKRQTFHYESVREVLEGHGYSQYEVSNFAKAGAQSIHNLLYWSNRPYLGLGTSAHSYSGSFRFSSVADYDHYLKDQSEHKEKEDFREQFIGRFRVLRWQSLHNVQATLSPPAYRNFLMIIDSFVKAGWIEQKKGFFRITREGLLFSDTMLVKVMGI